MSQTATSLESQSAASDGRLAFDTARCARYPEIDSVKGFALISVLLIHADPLAGTLLHEHVINRAVPVLLVLFGVSSELWWMRRSDQPVLGCALRFCRERYARLMPPVWATLVVWWFVMLHFGQQRAVFTGPWLVAHAFGYIPQVGTGWFVTLIVQLVLLFPLLHVAVLRLGWLAALLVSLALCWLSHFYALVVVDGMRALLLNSAPMHGFFVFYYAWIFAPARAFAIVVGILLARRHMQWPRAWWLSAVVLWGFGSWAHDHWLSNPFVRNALMATLDIPCTLVLLELARRALNWRASAWLQWVGRASWGMYLGQLLVHTSAPLFGFDVLGASRPERWLYAVVLGLGGAGWVLIGRAARELVRYGLRKRIGARSDLVLPST